MLRHPFILVVSLAMVDSLFGWSSPHSRRVWLQGIGKAVSFSASVVVSAPAFAASTPSPKELERLQKGHARMQYLLAAWDDVTKVCGTTVLSDRERKQIVRTEGGGGTDACVRNPLKVQEFMGYKSIEDPLFRVDKLMLKAAPLVDPDQYDDYLDTVERFREKADQTALLAYTSSWGEANPNGSKENVENYLEQTKAQVEESEKLLRAVLKFLNLEVLPPTLNP